VREIFITSQLSHRQFACQVQVQVQYWNEPHWQRHSPDFCFVCLIIVLCCALLYHRSYSYAKNNPFSRGPYFYETLCCISWARNYCLPKLIKLYKNKKKARQNQNTRLQSNYKVLPVLPLSGRPHGVYLT